jgi:DNA polymerase-3 subunit delta'
MPWLGIIGQDDIVNCFRQATRQGRLASSFLFVGPQGVGKRSFALRLAQSLLCQSRSEEVLEACGTCPACVQVAAGTHPDVEFVSRPPDKAFIPLELLIGDKEHRMQEGLCHNLSLRPFMGGRKIAIIDDADYLNAEGANCLLKTLEEPPPRSVLILIGTSPARQLPTIRSRCQLVRFRPLDVPVVASLLTAQGIASDAEHAQRLAELSEGSLQRARDLSDADLWAFRTRLYESLANRLADFASMCKELSAFVDQAGREAPARRHRLRQVVGLATAFYRSAILTLSGRPTEGDPELANWVARMLRIAPVHPDAIGVCLEHCLDAAEQIDRNANQATLIECWLDQLAAAGVSSVE